MTTPNTLLAVELPARRLPSFLNALRSLDDLGLTDVPTILAVATNQDQLREAVVKFEADQEQVVKTTLDRINTPSLATPNPQVQANPDFVIRSKIRELGNEVETYLLKTIDFTKLTEGDKKPIPGAVAELLPILANVDSPTT